MTRVLAHTLTPNGNIVQLSQGDDGYLIRLFVPEPDSDRELTADEAREWLKLSKAAGGLMAEGVGG